MSSKSTHTTKSQAKSADAKPVDAQPETSRVQDFREHLLPFSFMKESPIQNTANIDLDVEGLVSVLSLIKVAVGITRPIAVQLVDSPEMVRLNTIFRNCPENTDVLTFPSGLDDPLPLGDIAVCVEYAQRQATLRGVSMINEITALLVHACLHLVGYDDIADEDRTAMQHKMNEVGEQIGIPFDGEWTSILHQDYEHS